MSFKQIQVIALVCPEKMLTTSPVARSTNLAVPSELAVSRYAESAENTQSHTHFWCPVIKRSRLKSSWTAKSLQVPSAEQVHRYSPFGVNANRVI